VIPDGYVEPVPAVYDAIATYADRGTAAFGTPYFARLGKIARVLSALARLELANQPLPPDALAWLSMVTEILPYGSDGRPTYTGWYFDLFDARSDAIGRPDLIADIFTSPVEGIGYVGVQAPRIGVFVVDTGGGPRAMVGPVAHAYEYQGPPSPRLDDAAARKLAKFASPWTAYEVPAPPEPSFRVQHETRWNVEPKQFVLTFESKTALGNVTVELLDHHRVPIAKASRYVGAGQTTLAFPYNEDQRAETIHFQVGLWHGWGEPRCSDGCEPIEFGTMKTPKPWEQPPDE
jgi:hypothetical protein